MYQPTKEYNVRSDNSLTLFTLGHLVVGFRAKDLSLQPPEVVSLAALGAVGRLEAAVGLYYLLWRHSSKHFQGIYVLSVDPPQNTLLVKQTEKLVCCCGGESFREYLPDQPIERSWVLSEEAPIKDSLRVGKVVFSELEV